MLCTDFALDEAACNTSLGLNVPAGARRTPGRVVGLDVHQDRSRCEYGTAARSRQPGSWRRGQESREISWDQLVPIVNFGLTLPHEFTLDSNLTDYVDDHKAFRIEERTCSVACLPFRHARPSPSRLFLFLLFLRFYRALLFLLAE